MKHRAQCNKCEVDLNEKETLDRIGSEDDSEVRYKLITQVVNAILKRTYPDGYLTHGEQYLMWGCKNKLNIFGKCIYDKVNDPLHDDCVFCGEPQERK